MWFKNKPASANFTNTLGTVASRHKIFFSKCFRTLRKYSNKAYEMGKDKMIEERLKILKIDSFHK